MAMATMFMLLLLHPHLALSCDKEDNLLGLEFPQSVYTFSMEAMEPECKEACRILLYATNDGPAYANHSLIQELTPSPTLVFTSLEAGSYHLRINCSDSLVACRVEPPAVDFQVEYETPARVISVGSIKVSERNMTEHLTESPRPWCVDPWKAVVIPTILLTHFIGLRLISSLTRESRRG